LVKENRRIIGWDNADVRIMGNVQMAGFRTFIKNTADSLNVKGFTENLEDGCVRVVCEGEEDAIVLRGGGWMFRGKSVRWLL